LGSRGRRRSGRRPLPLLLHVTAAVAQAPEAPQKSLDYPPSLAIMMHQPKGLCWLVRSNQ